MKRFTFGVAVPDERLGRRERFVSAELSGHGWEISTHDQAGRTSGRPLIVPTASQMERAVRQLVDELLQIYFTEQTARLR